MTHILTKSVEGTRTIELEIDFNKLDEDISVDISVDDIVDEIDKYDAIELLKGLVNKFNFEVGDYSNTTPMESNFLVAINKLSRCYVQLSNEEQELIEIIASKY